jgi:plastocyanin
MPRSWTHSFFAVCLALAACGDDDDVAQPEVDATVPDAAIADAAVPDAAVPDAAVPDAAIADAAVADAAVPDAAVADAAVADAAVADAGAISVELSAVEFEFTPNEITVAPGQTLTVTLRNEGVTDHNLEFDIGDEEFTLENDVAPGEEDQLTFTVPNEPGEFVFYCPIGDHRQLGMTGTLFVTE